MSELQDLSYADLMALQARVAAGIDALTAARDKRYAESILDTVNTVVTEIPMTETPTSNYAGHRVSFAVTAENGREYTCTLDLRDVKRSAERKAEKDAKAEPEPAKA